MFPFVLGVLAVSILYLINALGEWGINVFIMVLICIVS